MLVIEGLGFWKVSWRVVGGLNGLDGGFVEVSRCGQKRNFDGETVGR